MSKLDDILSPPPVSASGSTISFEVNPNRKQAIKDLFLDVLDTANPLHDQNWYWKMRKEIEEF